MSQTVIGLFKDPQDASEAKQQLIQKGFSSSNIDISSSGATAKASSSYSNRDDDDDSFGEKVSRFFKNLFGSDDDSSAEKYSSITRKAGSLVTVHAISEEEAERAADILDDCGAADVDELANEYGYASASTSGNTSSANYGTSAAYGTTGTGITSDYDKSETADKISDYGSSRTSDLTDDEASLKVIKEDVQIGKKEVVTGGVRLKSRIVERPVEEELRLREENVQVKRTPVDRAATDSDFNTFKEGEIEMTEYAEVPEVTKEARVVEEITLSKDVNERTETVSDTVKETEVDVEDIDEDDVKYRNKK